MDTDICFLGNFRFKSGQEVCESDRCFVCSDGDWEERSKDSSSSVGS